MSDAAEVKLTGPAMPWRFPAGPGGAINGWCIPSGKHAKNYGKSQFLMGKLTISMAIFNSYVKLPEGKWMVHKSWKVSENIRKSC